MTQAITNISVDVLRVHPRNAEFFDDISGEEYDRFKKSIQDDGLLSPLIVAPDMTIISGHQRLKACKELGFKSVSVIIKDDLEDEDEKLKKLIAANFGRLKNDPVKQSKLLKEYERLRGVRQGSRNAKGTSVGETISLTQDVIAKELGVDVRTVQNIKRIGSLPQEFQDMITDGTINATTGFKIIARLSEEEQLNLLAKLPSAQKFTQAQIQAKVDELRAKTDSTEQALRRAISEKNRMVEEAQAEAEKQKERVELLESTPVEFTDEDARSKIDDLTQAKREMYEKWQSAQKVANALEEEKRKLELKHAQEMSDAERRIDSAVNINEDEVTKLKATIEMLQSQIETAALNDKRTARIMGRDVTEEELVQETQVRLNTIVSSTQCDLNYYIREHHLVEKMGDEFKESICDQGEALLHKLVTIMKYCGWEETFEWREAV